MNNSRGWNLSFIRCFGVVVFATGSLFFVGCQNDDYKEPAPGATAAPPPQSQGPKVQPRMIAPVPTTNESPAQNPGMGNPVR